MKKVTATYLTQKTRDVIDEVVRDGDPIVIYNYGKPVAVIEDYQEWENKNQKRNPTIEELKKYTIKTGKRINSTELIRKMRDEE